MDKLFSALSRPGSIEILERLLPGPPATQESLRQSIGIEKKPMSEATNALIDVRLVTRERPRGPCQVAEAETVGELLQLAADLDAELAEKDARRKKSRARELRKSRMSAGAIRVKGGTASGQ